MNVLEHQEDDLEHLASLSALLPSGRGRLVLFVPALQQLYGSLDREAGHFRRYHLDEMRRLLRKAGLRTEQIGYMNGLGAVSWWIAARVLRVPLNGSGSTRLIPVYDRFLIPVARCLDPALRPFFGQSLIAVASREPGPAPPPASAPVSGAQHSGWTDFFRYNPASRHRRRHIRRLIRDLPFRSVLDAGCGNGQLLHSLFSRDPRRASLEISAFDLNHEERPPLLSEIGARYRRWDVERAVLPESYDLVISSEVLEHTHDAAAAARNLVSMTNRWLLVTVPAGRIYPSDVAMGHDHHYSAHGLRDLFESLGLETLACFAWGFPFHSLYRRALNLILDPVLEAFGQERYSIGQIAACHLLQVLFFANVPTKGDQLFYLGERRGASSR
jgi:SAM-dependent methyltransferase